VRYLQNNKRSTLRTKEYIKKIESKKKRTYLM